MNYFRNIFESFFFLTLLLSCGGGHTENEPKKKEAPKTLRDGNSEIKSYRGSYDLMEELYEGLVENSPELKKLEGDLDAIRQKSDGLNEKFDNYNIKSNDYYKSATNDATAISDSLLKKKIVALITNSNNQYSTKTAELNFLLKQIAQNGSTLNDHHSVLKIVLTLPLIEKYQDDFKPDNKEFKGLIRVSPKMI